VDPSGRGKVSKPKRQHYVPQFYLKHFSNNPSKGVFVSNLLFKETGEIKYGISTRDICVKDHLYSPTINGNKDYSLENDLGVLEGSFSEIWRILARANVNYSESPFKRGLALFISNLILRSHDSFIEQTILRKNLIENISKLPKDKNGFPMVTSIEINGVLHTLDINTWPDFLHASIDDEKIEYGKNIRDMNADIIEDLYKKRWEMKVTNTDCFITTDNPITMTNSSKKIYGYNTPGTTIFFPITPRKLLIIDDRNDLSTNEYKLIDRTIADQINYILMMNAKKYMITNLDPDEVFQRIEAII
jgi:hypothetical protein